MRTAVRATASLVIGLLLLLPLGAAYGAAGLPVYHSWGLMHGSFGTAVPALVAAAFVALGPLPWFGRRTDVLARLVACACVFALVTTLFWVDQQSPAEWSVWRFMTYAAVFLVFLVLCFSAKHPLLVPLFLVIPLLIDPVFGLLLTIGYDLPVALQIFAEDFLRNILPAAVATGLAALFVHIMRGRGA